MMREALIRTFLESPMSGMDIETKSFEIIDREAPAHAFTPEQWVVARRMVHTAGEFSLLEALRFSPDAVDAGVAALRLGAPIYTDSNMIRAGLSLARLREVNAAYSRESVVCLVADEEVARQAAESGLPRSLHAVRKARALMEGGIVAFGNAPVGLLEVNRMILEEGARPALVIGLPVGFVHVVESKQELMELGVPYIALEGRRGGSNLAVSVIHALCSVALARENEQIRR